MCQSRHTGYSCLTRYHPCPQSSASICLFGEQVPHSPPSKMSLPPLRLPLSHLVPLPFCPPGLSLISVSLSLYRSLTTRFLSLIFSGMPGISGFPSDIVCTIKSLYRGLVCRTSRLKTVLPELHVAGSDESYWVTGGAQL